MFEDINFFRTESIYMDKLTHRSGADSAIRSADEVRSRQIAFDSFHTSSDIVIPGHTAILFPPLGSDFSSDHIITPQGFFLCDHWQGYYTKRENYQSFMISYTIGGEGTLKYDGHTYSLKAHDIFFIDCRKPQYYCTRGASWNHIDVHFWGPCAEALYQEFRSNSSPVCTCGPNGNMLQHLDELAHIWDAPRPYSALYISNKLLEIIALILTLSRQELLSPVQIDNFAKITKYIESHFSEDLHLDDLAKFASMSKYHFLRTFKKHTGLTPIQYVLQLRINRAKSMLESSELSVRQIAFSTGYNNINNFITHFKKCVNMTPSAYRNQFHS